ncbi:hypothetical protein R3I94_004125 [Phoxinus phoxinus]
MKHFYTSVELNYMSSTVSCKSPEVFSPDMSAHLLTASSYNLPLWRSIRDLSTFALDARGFKVTIRVKSSAEHKTHLPAREAALARDLDLHSRYTFIQFQHEAQEAADLGGSPPNDRRAPGERASAESG